MLVHFLFVVLAPVLARAATGPPSLPRDGGGSLAMNTAPLERRQILGGLFGGGKGGRGKGGKGLFGGGRRPKGGKGKGKGKRPGKAKTSESAEEEHASTAAEEHTAATGDHTATAKASATGKVSATGTRTMGNGVGSETAAPKTASATGKTDGGSKTAEPVTTEPGKTEAVAKSTHSAPAPKSTQGSRPAPKDTQVSAATTPKPSSTASAKSTSKSSGKGLPRPTGKGFPKLPRPKTGNDPIPKVPASVLRWDRRAKSHSFQIILSGTLELKNSSKSVTPDVDVYDIDLFYTDATTIRALHRLNKTVICYFSGGTYEPGRPDSAQFPKADIGAKLREWPKEHWLRTGSAAVRRIMANRIQLAAQKGCDAIDADNIDGYGERGGGGVGLKESDSINFVRFLAAAAGKYGMANGLKNALEVMTRVEGLVQFAVNEQCVSKRECDKYAKFRKPVFHIEYPRGNLRTTSGNPASRRRYCPENGGKGGKQAQFRTVLKAKKLDGAVRYCDGKYAVTPTKPEAKASRRSSAATPTKTEAKTSRRSSIVGRGMPKDRRREDNEQDDGPDDDEGAVVPPAGDLLQHAKAWQNDPDAIKMQQEIASKDGYPFALGKGSEGMIPDDMLGDQGDEEGEESVPATPLRSHPVVGGDG